MEADEASYGFDNIQVLSTAQAIRRRPQMFLGDDPGKAVAQNTMIMECLCHAVDEHVAGNCFEVVIDIFKSFFEVKYDAGMPLDREIPKSCGLVKY